MKVFILLADIDDTTRSRPYPVGYAVETEDEAKAWVEKSHFGYQRAYLPIKVVPLNDVLLDEEK